jgi:hypothetical protein
VKPFFLVVAPNAPHSNVAVHIDGDINLNDTIANVVFSAPVSAERHKHLFKDVEVPRTPNFNPKEVSGSLYPYIMAAANSDESHPA